MADDGVADDPTFADVIAANEQFASSVELPRLEATAARGLAVLTCMDSRIDPLGMLGLVPGDAKIFRNPGGRVTPQALEALVLGVHLLNVDRILVIPHTRCAMTASTQQELRERVSRSAGQDAAWQQFSVVEDQMAALDEDVAKIHAHPLIPESVRVGGFLYDVDTGRIERKV